MKRFALMATFALTVTVTAADPKTDAAKAKKGLQEIGEFIGQWNLVGDSKVSPKAGKEVIEFGWKFKGDDAWIALASKDSKFVNGGKLRFDPEKKKYTLTAADKDKKETVYTGEFKKGKLVLEAAEEKSKDVTKLTFNTLAEGVRLSLVVEKQSGGSGPFETVHKAAGTKEGENFAGGAAAKKNECIVTGGTGTSQVTYMGKSYWVCCSGCRDEFNANPQKYIDAAAKAKK